MMATPSRLVFVDAGDVEAREWSVVGIGEGGQVKAFYLPFQPLTSYGVKPYLGR